MRFAIATLGCKVNQYDSATIETRLLARGMERTEFNQAADVYIVNTCTVTNRADVESLRLARRARRLNPNARVVMTGCLAQASPGKLAGANEVDAVVGLGRLDDLERAIIVGDGERVMVSNLRKERGAMELGAVTLAGQTRAFLKLQEGCDQFCTFCIVPFSRGTSRSIEPRRVIEALEEAHDRGFREVTLSGVHLGGYGKDLSPSVELADLLEMIAERSPVRRVRLSSLDPEELSDRIIDIVAASEAFCPHLHLPLQAGEDEVLSRMRRRYVRDEFRARVERVVEAMPEAAIGTDLIVGFPGESAAQFDSYYAFVEKLPLAYFHVFPYSVRDGTTAAKMPNKVKPGEIKLRADAMRRLGEGKRADFARRSLGSTLNVLIEERNARGALEGYSRNYIRVSVAGPDGLINQEIEVEALTADAAQVAGRIVAQAEQNGAAAAAAE
ncbi:MAG TPA: tRNA (N(6)-L-threonylcarbamoyladenosine(37)-C(2))-methylthiotransferase MtaB [Candidatus Binataceae bacterium]|nr:tRNA (N(6)-L-threonylcarbamoyladenosine(37)-C(2))-methylthiotransferase MtaB [Candidatus Binataceae bacterium]